MGIIETFQKVRKWLEAMQLNYNSRLKMIFCLQILSENMRYVNITSEFGR